MADLGSWLVELAKEPAGPPVVTLYLDARWRDEQQRERVRLFFRERAREAEKTFTGDDDDARAIRRTLGRLERFVDELVNQDVHADARGVVVVASEPRGLFEELYVDRPFEPALFVDARPRLYPLIESASLLKPAYVVEIDSTGAVVTELRASEAPERHSLEREVPSRHKQGGWSQRKFSHHIRHHIHMVWDDCARLLAELVRDGGPGPIALFGQEPNLRQFARQLPEPISRLVVAMRPLPPEANALVESAREALDDERVRFEFETIHHVLRQALADRSGTVGLDDTLAAVNERRVKLLVLSHRFHARGFRCTKCDALWSSGGVACSYCGGETEIVDLREELVRRCLANGAEVLVTPESGPLDAYRGIGSLLRHLSGNELQRPTLAMPTAPPPGA